MHTSWHLYIQNNANTSMMQWKCAMGAWKQWQLAVCGLPLAAGPVGRSSQHQPAELLRGVLEFTRIIITLCSMALRGSLYFVYVCMSVCKTHYGVCFVSVWFLGIMSHSVVSVSLTSVVIRILVQASLLFVLTMSVGNTNTQRAAPSVFAFFIPP